MSSLVMCQCGQYLQVPASPVDQVVCCPRCSRSLRVPGAGYSAAYVMPSVMPSAPAQTPPLANRSVGIFWGVLILLTAVTPWQVIVKNPAENPEQLMGLRSPEEARRLAKESVSAVWSWDLLKENAAPTSFKAFLIGFWIVGFVGIVLAGALPRFPLAIAYMVLSIGALILTVAASSDIPGFGWPAGLAGGPDAEGSSKALNVAQLVLVIALMVFARARTRVGASIPIGIIEGLIAAGLAVVTGILLYKGIDGYRQFLDLSRASAPVPQSAVFHVSAITILVLEGMIGLAAVLALAHGAAVTMRSPGLSTAAVILINLVFWFGAPFILTMPCVAAKRYLPETTAVLNMLILLAGMVFLFADGAAGLAAGLTIFIRRQMASPRSRPAPAMVVPTPAPRPVPVASAPPTVPQAILELALAEPPKPVEPPRPPEGTHP